MKIHLTTKELSSNERYWKLPLIKGKTIDSKSLEITIKEKQIWRQVLTRLLDITKQNLFFRGYRKVLYSSNKGNYKELVELSQYNIVLEKHYLK